MKTLRALLLVSLAALAQETLTNESVVKMVKSGLGESLIVTMVQTQPGKYSLAADDLVKLKEAGVSEKVMTAMLAKASGGAPSGNPTTAAQAADPDVPSGIEIGVYYKKAGSGRRCFPK
jgi:hypothetical protein